MKIQHGRGLERNGAKVSKGGFVEKVALEPRLEFRKQKEGRKEGNTPEDGGHILGRGGGMDKGHPATQGSLLYRGSGRCA